jgi:hypothetical protein
MRKLTTLACSLAVAAALVASAGAQTDTGVLSVERGRGVVTLDLRGSVLGRLGNGTLRVTDHTPRDRWSAIVVGRKLIEEIRISPRTTLYRGQGLSFRMVGGGYRIVVRGNGIALSAVGRGAVTLDAEPRIFGEDAGVYSVDGVDCAVTPLDCTPLPLEAERFALGPRPEEGSIRGPS